MHNITRASFFRSTVLGLCLALIITACATAPDELPSPPVPPPAFSVTGNKALDDHWWHGLNDQKLNKHIEQSLQNNFSLAASFERLKAARALARRSRSDFYPDLDAVSSGSIRNTPSGETQSFSLGLEASYEVDLWGRIDAQAEAEELRAKASHLDYKTAALTLSGDVAQTWYRLIEARKQYQLAKDQLKTNKDVLDLLEARFAAGQIRQADILRQRTLVESSQENMLQAEIDYTLFEHQLAVLKGEPPRNGREIETPEKLVMPSEMPRAGLPSEVLQRRPDVARQYTLIEASDRDLAAAISNQYPRLNLSASLVSDDERDNSTPLLDDWISTLTASLTAPLFDGGERSAEVERQIALKKQQINSYSQTVLDALRDVEDALQTEVNAVATLGSIKKQMTLSQETYDQLQNQYLNGVTDYIDVLSSLRDVQSLERDYLRQQRLVIESRIALYRAIAGQFKTPHES